MPKGPDENNESFLSRFSNSRRSTVFIFYAALFITLSITSWGLLGYTDISGIVSIWALIILSFIFLLYAVSDVPDSRVIEKLPYLSLVLSIWLLILVSRTIYPTAYHDELAIDTYSAYLLLHHLDPYVTANMVNVFSFYNFPLAYTTPTTYGGVVYYLIYPALSVYAFIPVVVLGIPNYWIPILFNIAGFFLLFFYYRKNGLSESIPLLSVMAFVEVILFAGAVTGETDIIWAFFLSLAYVFRKKPWAAGLFLGLSLSQKQIPIVIAPFLLYLVYRERNRDLKSVLALVAVTTTTFLALNSPFIIMNPGAWLHGMLQSVDQPAIGVGFGFGILSFAGYAPLTSAIFSDLLITTLAFFFVFYIRYYSSVKYAFFAFPVIIFLFNFRSLENYLIFWPMLTLLVLPDYLGERGITGAELPAERKAARKSGTPFFAPGKGILKRSNFSIFLILVILAGGSASAGLTLNANHVYTRELQVNSVGSFQDPVMVNSMITSMNVNLSYTPQYNSPASIPVYFRIIPKGPVQSNINDLLWSAKDPYLKPGNNTLTIFPDMYSDFLPANTNFTLEAYYGNATSFYRTASPGSQSFAFQNPDLLFPTYDAMAPFPAWNVTTQGNAGNLSYQPGGITLTSNYSGDSWASISLSTGINFTYLAGGNFTMNYSTSGAGSYVNSSNSISKFSGVHISFNSGQENLWVGYNSSVNGDLYYQQSRVNQTIISSSTLIDFSHIMQYLKTQGWGFSNAVLSYTVAGSKQNASATFRNFTLTDNGATVGIFPPSLNGFGIDSPASVYSRSPPLPAVSYRSPEEVIRW